ncbi:BLUF domain-containing protein [Acinetobacter populi]|uniref:Blue light sensor protein n=1 Tax=Acinetobacter populi TaxID=1582270 RepID=A0A1Z9YZC5_9GAMM|nr:BLUF domain-containing protein [Acinetobacter populi]OUY07561.1 blue light sensor protein [Acinetobacter populi]
MKHRLLYVSKAQQAWQTLDPVLMDIISEAVAFNSENNITGVLYYGHGFFVQCLEGDKPVVEHLFYQKILKDPRHHHCEILYAEDIDTLLFDQWSMKFAPVNKNIKDFFEDYHLDEFNPYLLTENTTLPFIHVLAQEPHYEVDSRR